MNDLQITIVDQIPTKNGKTGSIIRNHSIGALQMRRENSQTSQNLKLRNQLLLTGWNVLQLTKDQIQN